jgi:hypothetical protein
MAIALTTYRFVGEGQIMFLVHECADAASVLLGMERNGGRHERCQLLLSGADWRQLCALGPFHSRANRADGVTLELHFTDESDYGDSLTIGRSPGCERVCVRMQCGAPGREELELSTSLSRRQWRYLTTLDVIAHPHARAPHGRPRKHARSPANLLRIVRHAQRSVATQPEALKNV